MTGIIDSDTHIAESEAMWDHLPDAMHARRPIRVTVPDDTLYGSLDAFWLIDGNIFPKPAGRGGFRLTTPTASTRESARTDISIASRELTDVSPRLADMDHAGVDIQIIYPTLFLTYLTDDVELDAALCHAYNQFLARAYAAGHGRLRWVAVLPARSIEDSLAQMNAAKGHGAVGILLHGMVGSLTLNDPHFFPIYAEASRLDLAICVHIGAGCPQLMNLFELERNGIFAHTYLPVLIAFRDLVSSGIPEKFPDLRFGFLEASASWVPFLVHTMRRAARPRLSFPDARWKHASTADLFRDYRLFVACEADEDLTYLAQHVGEDHLVIGSDYGHNDRAEERHLIRTLESRPDVSPALVDNILRRNPRILYGLDPPAAAIIE